MVLSHLAGNLYLLDEAPLTAYVYGNCIYIVVLILINAMFFLFQDLTNTHLHQDL